MATRSRWVVLVGFFLGATRSSCGRQCAKPDLKAFHEEVRKLVEKHYPKAKVTLKDQTIHFEFHTRKFMIHEPLLTGEWQDAHEEIGPQKGGIYGDIELRDGDYGGMAFVPQSFRQAILHAPPVGTVFQEARSPPLHPPEVPAQNVPAEFVKEFRSLMDGFEKHVTAPGK